MKNKESSPTMKSANNALEKDVLIIDGVNLEYRWIRGEEAGMPTLIFLHEGLGSIDMWNDFPDLLAFRTGCSALIFSRQGYGNSDPAGLPRQVSYMHREATDVFPKIIEELGIESHLVIGHSDGGSIAIIYAAGQPDGLRGLILEAPHVFVEKITVNSIANAKKAYEGKNLRDGLAKFHRHVDNTFYGWNDIWLHPDFLEWNIEEYLPKVSVPTLVLQSEDDPYGTLAQVDAIEDQIGGPFAKLILEDCGHAPHKDRKLPSMTAMSKFIEDVIKGPF